MPFQFRVVRPAAAVSTLALTLSLAAGGTARAQSCNSDDSAPPTATIAKTYTLGGTFLPPPIAQQNAGQAGCDGADGFGPDEPGKDGLYGQAAGGNDVTVMSGTITVGAAPAVSQLNRGGGGGDGGDDGGFTHGGTGGFGGAGGGVALAVQPGVYLASQQVVVQMQALGGAGRTGADGYHNGPGGGGGAGGALQLQFDGTAARMAGGGPALALLSLGGTGGGAHGGFQTFDNDGAHARMAAGAAPAG